MKRTVQLVAITLVIAVGAVAFGHHAAQGIVDDEIYDMIDAMVYDTPHAEIDFFLVPGGRETVIDEMMVRSLENMIDDGLLTYASMLDGDVTVNIAFDGPQQVSMTILQVK